MPRKACKIATSWIHKTGQKSTSIINRRVLIFCKKYIRLIFLPHFTTTTSDLYHSRYGFWQIHFRHLVLHMRLLHHWKMRLIHITLFNKLQKFFLLFQYQCFFLLCRSPIISKCSSYRILTDNPIFHCQFKTGIQ